jgi:ribosome maturation factor RimP
MPITMRPVQEDIEHQLSAAEPEVEVLLAEPAGAGTLRLFIDHPRGVDLALCERVTKHLSPLLADVGLEVSSPGPRRPLTKPQHFQSFVGRRAKVRTRAPHGGRTSFTGQLLGADEREVTIAADEGVVTIPLADINKSNLLEG